jgi:hypothetical protein
MGTKIEQRVPPLEAGDRLTRAEFLRRWEAHPEMAGRRYRRLAPDRDGLLRSRVFPGLWLDSKALLERNLQQVLARLQEGLNSREHKRFVAKLARRKRPGKS